MLPFTITPLMWILIGIIVIWDTIWKALGLFKSARNGQTVWFVFIFILNTVGILPIIYLAYFQKKKK